MKDQNDQNICDLDLDGIDTDHPSEGSGTQAGHSADVNTLDLSKMDLSDLANIDFDSLNDMDLPDKLIVTHVDDSVFASDEAKRCFENLFKRFDPEATFCYLKSFRRAQVCYSSIAAAVRARIELDNLLIGVKKMKCYFAQTTPQPNLVTDPYLLPPKPVKQFLISPPPSPPEGWEPIEEHGPVIDYELLAALAKLAPGEAHVVHPASNNNPSHPSIVVHICENPEGYLDPTKPRIEQTRHPKAY